MTEESSSIGGAHYLKSCIQDGRWVNHPTSIKVLRFPPIYMGLGRYLPAILYTRLQDRTEALLEESDRRARDKGIRREELMRLCRILTSYVGFSTTTLCTGSII